MTIRGLVETVLARLGRRLEDCADIGPERPGMDSAYLLDSFKLRSELGWRDTVSLAAGIDACIAWARRFGDELARLPMRYEHKP